MIRPSILGILAFAIPALALQSQQVDTPFRQVRSLGDGAVGSLTVSPDGRFVAYLWNPVEEDDSAEVRVLDRQRGSTFRFGPGYVDLSWSPDGDRLAFARRDEQGRTLHVWVQAVDPETGRPAGPPRRVGLRPGRGPAFSPDGRRIAFTVIPATDTVAPRVAVMPADGGPERVVYQDVGWAQQLAWSPDGDWIYFRLRRGRPSPDRTVVRVSPETGRAEDVAEVGDFVGISPDGRRLAVIVTGPQEEARPGPLRVRLLRPDGDPVDDLDIPRSLFPRRWNPGGSSLVATRTRWRSALQSVDMSGRSTRAIWIDGRQATRPVHSPDGEEVAFFIWKEGGYRLILAELGEGKSRTIEPRARPNGSMMLGPVWSPDGTRLAFPAEDGTVIAVVDVEGGHETTVSAGERVLRLTWGRRGEELLVVSDRGRGTPLRVRSVPWTGPARTLKELPWTLSRFTTPVALRAGFALLATDSELIQVDVGSGASRVLLRRATVGVRPSLMRIAVSRDGRWLAAAPRPGASTGSGTTVRIVSLATGEGRTRSFRTVGEIVGLRWHPDGRSLLGLISAAGTHELRLLPIGGDPPRTLTEFESSGRIRSFGVSPSGREVVYWATRRAQTSLWTLDLDSYLDRAVKEGSGAP